MQCSNKKVNYPIRLNFVRRITIMKSKKKHDTILIIIMGKARYEYGQSNIKKDSVSEQKNTIFF
jgi:hypothetical protein